MVQLYMLSTTWGAVQLVYSPVLHRTSERANMKYSHFVLRATGNGRREASTGEIRAFYMSLYNTMIL